MGGGGSKCTKRDVIDPKPSVTLDTGITIAGSSQCTSCSLTVSSSASSSVINLRRDKHTLILEPAVPLSVNFNGVTAVFNQIRLYAPAPTAVEHVNADAVLHCVSDVLWLFIPLKAADIGPHTMFLSAIVNVLNPATKEGLGIVDPATNRYYEGTVAAPGQDWSISSIVDGAKDPYFTWVNGRLDQYTISDSECERHLGWRSSSGPQVVYMQNSVNVASADIAKLRTTIGTVLPADVGLTISNTMYSPGQVSCPTPLPKLKLPTFKPNPAWVDAAVYFGVLLIAFLAVVAAVSLASMTNGPIQYISRGFWKVLGSPFPASRKISAPAPAAAPGLSIPLPGAAAAAAAVLSKK
jgi:hypothetical protein